MIKILFLIKTLSGGGAEKVLVDLVNSLPYDKYCVTVQTIEDIGIYRTKLKDCIEYKSIVASKNKFIRRVWMWYIYRFSNMKKIYNKYIKNNYEIEVAFLEGMSTRIISYSTEHKSKKIAWVHTDLVKNFASVSDYKSYDDNRLAYFRFDKIACVSDSVRFAFVERFGETNNIVNTVYNVIDDKQIKKKAICVPFFIKKRNKYINIVTCGRLCKQKGYMQLLKIHKRLLDEGLVHNLWIIGEGPDHSELEQYIVANNLFQSAILWGFQENPYQIMSQADLFVSSSIVEGYSTVITEALVLGLPIISTKTSGAFEPALHPRCNSIVDVSEIALYQELKRVLLRPELLECFRREQKEKLIFYKKETLLKGITDFIDGSTH